MEDFAATLPGLVSADPDLQAFQYELKLEAARSPELRRHADALYETYRDAVREALVCFDLSEDLVDIVFAALEGLVFQQVTSGDPRRTEEGCPGAAPPAGGAALTGWRGPTSGRPPTV
ncbi:hypothetical protein [Streptomyces acidiscabies]|uniref:hypothetical protein n=1 Tax=Streptomyces acidiscabies TaxID=42234 RepID=UPI001CBC21BF